MVGFVILQPSTSLQVFVPYELSERILQYCRVDFKCLASSALVCRSWAYASRSCLFEKLTFRPELAQRFMGLISPIAKATLHTPPASTYCRTLHIRNMQATNTFCPFSDGDSSALLNHPLQPLFSTLTTLAFSHSTFPPIEKFMIFLSHFPTLLSLSLDDVHWDKQHPPSQTTIPPGSKLPSITSLDVRNVNWSQFFNCINNAQLLMNVTRLHVGPVDEWDIPPVSQYLFNVSPNLEYFSLRFKNRGWRKGYVCGMAPVVATYPVDFIAVESAINSGPVPLDSTLPGNGVREEYRRIWGLATSVYPIPKLKDVRIEQFVDTRFGVVQPTAIFWAPRVIASIIPPSIQRLELTLMLERAGQLDQYEINWKFLEYALCADDYKSLKRLVFRVGGPVDLVNLGDLISARLPIMAERGMLEFCRMEVDAN
ncbi:hypothetical protein CVT24_001617 [Panaeolus cyanescens]|uniref:F-box domain-containing protein n=1 Tax=Panaeolus cyanescens TaxID=181874 RepID=A0A409W3I7_9AGAR|nr:hypothetical protein CVT24_001617 [Panaeolus cyanescens]